MRVFWGLSALLMLIAGMVRPADTPAAPDTWTLLISGDTQGYLSPCGCTKPMIGGIRRRAALVRQLTVPGRTVVLEAGRASGGLGRQDVLKTETLAQLWQALGVDAVALSGAEARLGSAQLAQVQRLSGDRMTTLAVQPGADVTWERWIERGPFLIGSLDPAAAQAATLLGGTPVPEATAVGELLAEAEALGKSPILMIDGNAESARLMAKRWPALALIIYRSDEQAAGEPLQEGKTWLVSPGPKAKAVLQLSFRDGEWRRYQAIPLGPEIEDDPEAAALFRQYVDQVREEQLLEQVPRGAAAGLAGSDACMSCHNDAYNTWHASAHAKALRTLEQEHQDRDPDCVGCHVVGLDRADGFNPPERVTGLDAVGCESCHGGGKAHVTAPFENPMPKVGKESCMTCHVPDHSPTFDYESYWEKIKH